MARGSIRERSGPTGKAWQIRVYGGIDPATGQQRQLARTIRGSRRDAEAALNRLLTEVDAGHHTGPDGPYADLLAKWVDLKTPRWSPKTRMETRGMIDRWIAPGPDRDAERRRRAPGALAVHAITTDHLDVWYGWLGGRLEPSTVRRIHGVVRASLEQAVRWNWILRNPAAYTEPIEGQPAEIQPPTPATVRGLLAALAEEPEIATFVRLAAVTGRRRGELCALRWTDIDLAAGTVTFTRTLADSENDGWIEQPISKNKTRFPAIAIDPATVAALEQHRQACVEALLAVGLVLPIDGHVFVRILPGGTGIGPWSPDGASRRFARVRELVGIDSRLHDLRHYVATTLLDEGVALPSVASRLGHGVGGRTTQAVYAHWVPASDQHAAAVLGRLLDDADD